MLFMNSKKVRVINYLGFWPFGHSTVGQLLPGDTLTLIMLFG